MNLIDKPNVVGSWVSPGEYGGGNASIEVEIDDENVRGEIPEFIDGVPLTVNYVEKVSLGCNTGHTSDAVPGDVKCAPPDKYDTYGTLASPIYDTSVGKRLFATSGHLYNISDSDAITEPLYQPDSNYEAIGSVSDQFCYEDLVVADPINNHSPQYEIKGADPSLVVGYFSKAGLSDLKAQNEPIEKIGARTCHTQGQIKAVDGETQAYGCFDKYGQLKWGTESDMGDGDSGSVNYHPDPENPNDYIMIGGMNNARTWWVGADYVWGTAAYYIANKHGLEF